MPVTRDDTQPLGVVYTPPHVARAMTRLAIAPLVDAALVDAARAGAAPSHAILSLRICDPAAGAGAFLVEVVDHMADHLVAAWQREGRSPTPALAREARALVARTCIAGVDIDAHALLAAARRLDLDGDASTSSRDTKRDHPVRIADALTLDWPAAFPDVFANGGFDVVLANPPYIRQESLDTKTALEDFEVYDGVADLYVYFVELAHRLLRPGGRYCVIVPNKWMTVEYGRPLRTFLARATTLDGVADLSTHALFANADAFPCIVWGTVSAPSARPLIGVRAAASESVEDVLGRACESSTAQSPAAASPTGTHIPRDRWSSEPWHIDASSDRFLLERLAHAYPTLGDVIGSRWSRGVVTGLNDAFVIDRATRDMLLAADLGSASWIRPFLRGRDVRSYLPAPIDRWLLLVDRGTSFDLLPLPIRDHLARFRDRLEPRPIDHAGAWPGRKPGSYQWYELQDPVVPLARSREPRLFYQDIQTAPACALDRTGELVPDTTVWILPSTDRYLLAILNSRLYGWYARRRFPPALNGAVRPKLAHMQRLPIPVPSADLRREIEILVERRIGA
ncbi:MAG: Eco57I restriction-modification methylase domain-containing protein, partial [Kofleriaceae bacterium]